MRDISQLLRGVNSPVGEALLVKAPFIVLLTSDAALENVVADALVESGGVSHLACDAGEALQIVCGTGRDLDAAIIDFEHGPHGITLLEVMKACRENLPVIVITRDDQQHVQALACAKGAAACFSKPIVVRQLAQIFQQCCHRRDALALAI